MAVKLESHSSKHLASHRGFPLPRLPSPLQILWWEAPGITVYREEGAPPLSADQPAVLLVLRLAGDSEDMRGTRAEGPTVPLLSQECSLLQAYHRRQDLVG